MDLEASVKAAGGAHRSGGELGVDAVELVAGVGVGSRSEIPAGLVDDASWGQQKSKVDSELRSRIRVDALDELGTGRWKSMAGLGGFRSCGE